MPACAQVTVSSMRRPSDGARHFSAAARTHLGQRVVRVSGELDLASRNTCFNACVTRGRGNVVVVDMSALTFMDCSGYAVFIAVDQVLAERGTSLVLRNPTGQPAHLLQLLGVTRGVSRVDERANGQRARNNGLGDLGETAIVVPRKAPQP